VNGERTTRPLVLRGLLLGLALLLAGQAQARLLARVEPGWSPFAQGAVADEVRSLVAEARSLLGTDPARVAFILGKTPLPEGASGRVLRGLWADALYQVGGDGLFEAQRLYRGLETESPEPAETAWVRFMLANTHRALGFDREADALYRSAAQGPEGAWTPALAFDRAALALDAGRAPEARDGLRAWIERYPGEPGRPLALYLLGEAEATLGDAAAAREHFREARVLAPDGWLVRAGAGYALAELLRGEGRIDEATVLLETLAAAREGTAEAAQARLSIGEIWESRGEVARAARSYARLLEEGTTPEAAREARLRLALLGAEHASRVELTEPFPSYRVFYRPAPALAEVAGGREPLAAQRALQGLAGLARREGRVEEALGMLVRVFREYPESAESGRAYEAFMAGLEGLLAERLAAGAYGDVVVLFGAMKGPVAWAPTRETGSLAVQAADAYEALGTPALARSLYEGLLARGTRALSPQELKARILRTRAAEGDPEALRSLAQAPKGWRALLSLARSRAASGAADEARRAFLEAVRMAPGPAEQAAILAEADALLAARAATPELLEALRRRRSLWETLAPGPGRAEWEAHGRVVEGRLRYAAGEPGAAAALLREVPDPGPEDRYLLALAERASGQPGRAQDGFRALAGGNSPLFAGLARMHLEVAAFLAAAAEAR